MRIFLKLSIAFIAAVVLSSYFEKTQVNLFMSLRELLFVPNITIGISDKDKVPEGMPLKASKDGYYVNPYQAASIVFDASRYVIASGCSGLDELNKRRLVDFAGYFERNAVVRSYGSVEFAVWPYPINFSYGVKPGWISGMAQANIGLLLAAASKCSDGNLSGRFKKMSFLAISSLEVPVQHGGVLVDVKGGNWYEEYAQSDIRPPLVLNGHVYALLALDALGQFDIRARRLFTAGAAAVRDSLGSYNGVTWSYYDTLHTPANNIYQQALHARQMKQLYEITGEDIFLKYHHIFSLQRLSPFSSIHRLILLPSRFLFFILTFDFLFMCIVVFALDRLVFVRRRRKDAAR